MVDGKLSVADAIARLLAKMGARRCFGVLGTANFKITDALCGAGVQYIPAKHEGNAASMGDAYARLSDELVLVSVHSGPGLSNSITGIGEAAKKQNSIAYTGWRCRHGRSALQFLY
jgi:acetolactate synthase I/II/III large subunit